MFKPLERGFAYVALSRARRRDTCYQFGRIRSTGWLPVVGDHADEQTTRSVWSEVSSEDSGDERSSCSSGVWDHLQESARGSLGVELADRGGSSGSEEEGLVFDGEAQDVGDLGGL